MTPTRILRAPYKIDGFDRLGRPRHKIMIDTDAGTFETDDLARAIGVHTSTFRVRLNREGWNSPHALNPPAKRGYRVSGAPLDNENQGNAEWKALGKRVRNENLARIPG